VTESPILFEKRDGGIAWLTLNRPDVLAHAGFRRLAKENAAQEVVFRAGLR